MVYKCLWWFFGAFFFFLERFFLLMFKMYFSSSRNKLKKLRTGCGIYLICHTFSSDLSLHLASSENSPHSFSEIHFIFRVALRKKPSFWPMPVLLFFMPSLFALVFWELGIFMTNLGVLVLIEAEWSRLCSFFLMNVNCVVTGWRCWLGQQSSKFLFLQIECSFSSVMIVFNLE